MTCSYCHMNIDTDSDGWGWALFEPPFHLECLEVYEEAEVGI